MDENDSLIFDLIIYGHILIVLIYTIILKFLHSTILLLLFHLLHKL